MAGVPEENMSTGWTRTGNGDHLPGYRFRLGVHGKRGGKVIAEEIAFLDERGKEIRRYRQFTKPIRYLLADLAETHVVVVEDAPEVEPNGDMVRFLDAGGRELWRTTRCCGGDARDNIIMAENGSVIAILDVGEGERCAIGEDLIPAPPGCVGLRIFTAEGKEILREPKGKYPHLSPRGLSVVFHDGEQNWLLNVKSQKREPLPRDVGRSVHGVSDEGIVLYYSDHGWNPPGAPRLRFVPGKGLEKLKD
jgi:hypothetical protein